MLRNVEKTAEKKAEKFNKLPAYIRSFLQRDHLQWRELFQHKGR